MNIILNEKEVAEKILNEGIILKGIGYTANLLCRYYYHEIGLRKAKIYEKVNDFLKEHSSEYTEQYWYQRLEKYAQRAKKYPLIKIDYIPIYQQDLEYLKSKTLNEQKILFTCICIVRYYNKINKMNNNWVNVELKDIFKLSNVNGTRNKKYEILRKLNQQDEISFSKKINNTNFKLNFFDDYTHKDEIYQLKQFSDLGYTFELLNGNPDIYHCKNCGKLLKVKRPKKLINSNNTQCHKKQYCDDCRKIKERERYIRYHKKKQKELKK